MHAHIHVLLDRVACDAYVSLGVSAYVCGCLPLHRGILAHSEEVYLCPDTTGRLYLAPDGGRSVGPAASSPRALPSAGQCARRLLLGAGQTDIRSGYGSQAGRQSGKHSSVGLSTGRSGNPRASSESTRRVLFYSVNPSACFLFLCGLLWSNLFGCLDGLVSSAAVFCASVGCSRIRSTHSSPLLSFSSSRSHKKAHLCGRLADGIEDDLSTCCSINARWGHFAVKRVELMLGRMVMVVLLVVTKAEVTMLST
ncbi:unnamed protein product [Protopolystoma xenopodis]|uniref:Uncharacterized protein n=1 Tax=Protopolystoma xenopodis TaxID=117903 RepID=A0A448WAD2_9PLAT|nr:unnamed protein product [Protopolystoma xenopodis]